MTKTRLSLYYLATYLTVGGIGFILMPQTMLALFFSNGNYSNIMVRFNGVLLLSLGIFVIQLIRHQVSELYGTTLIVRTMILIALVALYFSSRDPLMISLLVIVGLGFVLTLTSYILDHKNKSDSSLSR